MNPHASSARSLCAPPLPQFAHRPSALPSVLPSVAQPVRASRAGLAVLLVATSLGLGGCANLGQVKPWEKGLLAKPEMGFEGDRLETLLTEHTYASKEAASGGNGVGGGGCGCN